MRIAACLLLLALAGPALCEELVQDFTKQGFDENKMRFAGKAATDFVSAEPEGIRVRFRPAKSAPDPSGVVWRFAVRGNFVASAKYEILEEDRPTNGWGIGIELYLMLSNEKREGISYCRSMRAKEGPVFSFTYLTKNDEGKRVAKENPLFPTTTRSKKGILRLAREGTILIASAAEGDRMEFQELHRTEIGTVDIRMVRLAGVAGGSADTNLDVRFLEFQLKGDELGYDGRLPPVERIAPNPAGDATDKQEESTPARNTHVYLIVVPLLLIPFIVLVPLYFFLRRQNQARPITRKPSRADESAKGAGGKRAGTGSLPARDKGKQESP